MKPLSSTFYKRIIFSSLPFFFLLFSILTLSAKKVELNTATQVALNVFSENSLIPKNSLKIKEVLQLEHKGEIALRIFNFEPTGFIVISAEYSTEPVLGYGFDSNFNFEDAPPGLLFLLDEYKSEIQTIKEMGLKADVEINNKWKNYSSLEYASLKSYSLQRWRGFAIRAHVAFPVLEPFNPGC